METMERDPIYIAAQLKRLRALHRLTQENVADAAGLNRRTIEKIESGRHRPDEQTLRLIARALNHDVRVFEKPDPGDEARAKAEMEQVARTLVVVATHPIRTARDFLRAFDFRDAFRFNMSEVAEDDALDIAAGLGDWLRDIGDVWDECYMSQRVEYAREFIELCGEIEQHGYVCYMGSHRQQLRQRGRPPLIFNVGLLSLLPKDGPEGVRYAIVQLDDGWESLEADRSTWDPVEEGR